MKFINTTARYEHKEKGGIYVIKAIHKMKHPDSGEWIPCVTYKSVLDNRIWTRSLQSFVDNFEDYDERRRLTTSPVEKCDCD